MITDRGRLLTGRGSSRRGSCSAKSDAGDACEGMDRVNSEIGPGSSSCRTRHGLAVGFAFVRGWSAGVFPGISPTPRSPLGSVDRKSGLAK
jgi:hypothetical protein